MQNRLFVYLAADNLTNPIWVTDSHVHHGEIESLAQAAANREVVVIVPAEDVLLLTANLPKMNRARLLQALPYALEEQLVADIEELHFAVGDYQADGSLPVAVVAHAKMQQWLGLLHSWNVVPDKMVPFTFVLPTDENAWHALIHEMVVVRSGLMQGFAGDKNNANELLTLALNCRSTPELIYLHNYTDRTYTEMLNLTVPVKEVRLSPEQLLPNLLQEVNLPPLNLLQGKYAVKKAAFPRLKLSWKLAAYLLGVWVILLFLYPSISYLILKQQLNAIDKQIAQIYKRHFPQASSIVAPELRMQEKLRDFSNYLGENRPLLLLGLIGQGIVKTPSIKLKRFDFQHGLATLELTAATSEDFSAFSAYLMQHNLKVKQQNAHLVGGKVSAILQIE